MAEEGLKFDAGKPRYDLLPPKPIEDLVSVLTFGATKYAPGNWRYVDDANNRYYSALIRHIQAWRQGEQLDPETKLPHLAHAMCNLVFLMEFDNASEYIPT